jgi:hypothetical protein
VAEYLAQGAMVAAIVALGGFFLRTFIQSNLQHHFDRKIELLKNDLGRNNSRLDAIQSSTLSLMSTRHAALDNRRLSAIEALWSATIRQRRFTAAAKILQSLNLDEIGKAVEARAEDREKVKLLGDALLKFSGLENANGSDAPNADSERLFVPPLAWAAFEALRSVGTHAAAVLVTIKSGVSLSLIKDISEVNRVVLIALPDMGDFLKKYPKTGVYFMTDQLSELIFEQLSIALEFPNADTLSVDKANAVINRIENLEVAIPGDIPKQFLRSEAVVVP